MEPGRALVDGGGRGASKRIAGVDRYGADGVDWLPGAKKDGIFPPMESRTRRLMAPSVFAGKGSSL